MGFVELVKGLDPSYAAKVSHEQRLTKARADSDGNSDSRSKESFQKAEAPALRYGLAIVGQRRKVALRPSPCDVKYDALELRQPREDPRMGKHAAAHA